MKLIDRLPDYDRIDKEKNSLYEFEIYKSLKVRLEYVKIPPYLKDDIPVQEADKLIFTIFKRNQTKEPLVTEYYACEDNYRQGILWVQNTLKVAAVTMTTFLKLLDDQNKDDME